MYEQTGDEVRRDLFADDHNGIFLTDSALLDTLARDKLAPLAEQVRAEGWAWVDAAPRATASDLYQFQRARSTRREPTKTEAKRIAKLEDRQAKLHEQLDDENEDMTDEQAQALQDAMDALGNELEAAERKLVEYPPAVVALAGAIVSVDSMGGMVVHRGLLRKEQAKVLRDQARQEEGGAGGNPDADTDEPAKSGISEKLAKRLSAHRTAALQAEVARHPHVLREAWARRLPNDQDALFAKLLAFPQQELLSLLAVCLGSTVSALASQEGEIPATALAQAVDLDMHDWWTPTAAGCFEHVSKAKALEAVQVFAPDQVNRLGKLRKAEIASEAELLAAGTMWLPVMFRAQEAAVEVETEPGREVGGDADVSTDASGSADSEVHEDAHAEA